MKDESENISPRDYQDPGKEPNRRGLFFPLYLLNFIELGHSKDFKELLETILAHYIYFKLTPYDLKKQKTDIQKEILKLGFQKYFNKGYFKDIDFNKADLETLSVLLNYLKLYKVERIDQEIKRAKKAQEIINNETELRGKAPYCSISKGQFFSYLDNPSIKNEQIFRVYVAIKSILGTPKKGNITAHTIIRKTFILIRARGIKSNQDNAIFTARSVFTSCLITDKQLRTRLKEITETTDIKSYTVRKNTYYQAGSSKLALQQKIEAKILHKPIIDLSDELPF